MDQTFGSAQTLSCIKRPRSSAVIAHWRFLLDHVGSALPFCANPSMCRMGLSGRLCALAYIRIATSKLGLLPLPACSRRGDAYLRGPGHHRHHARGARSTIQRRTIFSPRCRQRTTSACCPIWNSCPCRWAGRSTNPAVRRDTCISPPTASCRCSTSWRTASSAEIAVVGNEGVVGIALFMGGETTPEPRGGAKRGLRLSAQGQAS